MPELPEIETLKRELSSKLKNKIIKEVVVLNKKSTAPFSVKTILNKTAKQKIINISRRAKILALNLKSGDSLVFHLKMTGQLIYVPTKGKIILGGHPQKDGEKNLPNSYTRAVIYLTDGSQLFFNDMRKFGWMRVYSPAEMLAISDRHGIEPLSSLFILDFFESLLKKYPNRNIKQLLLDQTKIAGIGNIYADESCFIAKILPGRRVGSIKKAEIKRLHQAIKDILTLSIKNKGTSFRDYKTSSGKQGGFSKYLKVYGREKQKCLRCKKNIIQKNKTAGRGTHFCLNCQK